MAQKHQMQKTGPESQESVMGDGVPRNGVEDQAARRAHMREQTMARQAAERNALRPSNEAHLDRPSRLAGAREREADLQMELTRINTAHQDWLRENGSADPPESESQESLPADTMTPE